MSSDADVIRCASPWPGTAAQLLEAFAELGAGEWMPGEICALTARISVGEAIQVMSGLELVGICTKSDYNKWSSTLSVVELKRLALLLQGAEHYRRQKLGASDIAVAVTMPMSPSHLENALSTPATPATGYLRTNEAFFRLARAASRRLVVLMPFIDAHGFLWVHDVFRAASSQVEKILVLRDVQKYTADLSIHHASWLRGLNISVRDYFLPSISRGRALPIETFHAKILLADDNMAYVGSANLMGTGEGTSLEAGVVVDGQAAIQISRLIEGILRVARRL